IGPAPSASLILVRAVPVGVRIGVTVPVEALATYAVRLSGVIAMFIVLGQAWPMGMDRRAVLVAVRIGTTMPSWSWLDLMRSLSLQWAVPGPLGVVMVRRWRGLRRVRPPSARRASRPC